MIELNDENFTSSVATGTHLVDFYRQVGCQYCRMLVPVLEQLSQELQGKIQVAKVDVFAAPDATSQMQITSVPTLVLIRDGKPVKRLVGLQDLNTLKNFCEVTA